VTDDLVQKEKLLKFLRGVRYYIGHNFLAYDYPALHNLLELDCGNIADISCDTLIVSRLVNYSRPQGHSLEAYGEQFGLPKIKFNDWTKWSQEMEDYCIRDVEINHRTFALYDPIINDPSWASALNLEHNFQLVVNKLHDNGFCFNRSKASILLSNVNKELDVLDKEILKAFPPKEVLIREYIPKLTKFGTISRTSVPRAHHDKIHTLNVGEAYKYTRLVPFNPASHKQLVEVLNAAGWKPEDKTAAHIEALRNVGSRLLVGSRLEERKALNVKLDKLKVYGYKINESNLSTLPNDAPKPARLLAKRILLESRRRTLTEWLGLVQEDGRIHGKFNGVGAWTHRMSHQQPNTANIPNEFDLSGKKKLLGKEMRALWCAPPKRLLVGVDAEGIQLRIFAHLIDDPEFTQALVEGKKDDQTDPHSLNKRILGEVCKTRAAAKRFVYALLLGGGISKLASILETGEREARAALDRLMERYQGFARLKRTDIPRDGKRGYFIGLDGRRVPIPGDTANERSHLAMSGYLQNGEAIIMKKAALRWHDALRKDNSLLVNFVHDEWQTEVPNRISLALKIATIQADSLRLVGEELKLKCPLAGSYWNDDHKDYTIGNNWSVTH